MGIQWTGPIIQFSPMCCKRGKDQTPKTHFIFSMTTLYLKLMLGHTFKIDMQCSKNQDNLLP